MLPGQTVNVLDIPIELKLPTDISASSSVESLLVFTLDPKDKYLPQGARRTASTSAIQSRKNSIATILAFKSGQKTPPTGSDNRDSSTRAGQSTLSKPRSLASVVDILRQTRSAGGLSWPRKVFSRSGSRAGDVAKTEPAEDVPPVPRLPSWVPEASPVPDVKLELPIQRSPSAKITANTSATSPEDLAQSVIVPWPSDSPTYTTPVASKSQSSQAAADKDESGARINEASTSIGHLTSLQQLREGNAFFSEIHSSGSGQRSSENLISALASQAGPTIGMRRGFGNQALYWEKCSSEVTSGSKIFDAELVDPRGSYTESSGYSSAASDDCSPCLTSNTTQSGLMSPLHLSQPETPFMSDFEDDNPPDYPPMRHDRSSSFAQLTFSDLDQSMKPPSRTAPAPPPARTSPPSPLEHEPALVYLQGGFQGYSLPDADHASVLTIRKVPSTTFKPADAASPFTQQGKQEMVHAWNDGTAGHRLSQLGELMEACGYLGNLIS